MSAAMLANHLSSPHVMAIIQLLVDCITHRGIKTRPTATGIVFVLGGEQRLAANHAGVNPLTVFVIILAAKRRLSSFILSNFVLFGVNRPLTLRPRIVLPS